MVKSKINTYIGFCIKSRKIALGSGAIDALRGGVYLLIVDDGAANNTKKLALKFQNRFQCPLLICKSGFEEAVNRAGCKIAAVRDGELAKAIVQSKEDNYELYSGGNF